MSRMVFADELSGADAFPKPLPDMRLCLSDPPRIERPDGPPVPLTPKDTALLTWLAVEGPTARTRLGALLWPASGEAQALTTLRQRLFKLKKAIGSDIAVGSPVLRLSPKLVDPRGVDEVDLPDDLTLDDAPEFDAWLRTRKDERRGREADGLRARVQGLEDAGDVAAALPLADALVRMEPVSEAAYQRLMRLHYLQGDRAAALAAFDRCEQALKHELGARPSTPTLALLAAIEQGSVDPLPVIKRTLPVSVLRPPRMVGRARELAALEAAWTGGKVAAAVAEAGMGKSRLLAEFVELHPGIVRVAGRPGDAGVPLATLARLLRAVGERAPLEAVGADARRQLARVLPELGEQNVPLVEGQRLQLHGAIAAYLRSAQGLAGLAVDDLHFADAASLEILQSLIDDDDRSEGRWLLAWRPADRDGALRSLENALRETYRLATVELAPLEDDALEELVDELDLGLRGASIAAQLRRRTGGNPLFVLETLKQAFADRSLAALGTPGAVLPRAQSVERLIDRRVGQLSPGAMALARIAGIASVDFTIDLAESVLGSSALQFADALNELEAAQVLKGTQFVHDLVFDAVRRSVPEAVARHAHGKIAAWLEVHQGEPARIARHWIDAGEAARSLPWLRRAADQAATALRNVESLAFLDEEAALEEALGLRAAAFETRLAGVLIYEGDVRSAEACDARCDALEAVADSEAQRIRAWLIRARLVHHRRDLPRSERYARRALTAATAGGHVELVHRSQLELFEVLLLSFRVDEALALAQACLPWIDDFVDQRAQMSFHSALATLYDSIGRLSSGQRHHLQAIALAAQSHDLENQAIASDNYASSRMKGGQLRLAVAMRRQSAHLAAQVEAMERHRGVACINLANDLAALGEYAEALELCDEAEARLALTMPSAVAAVHACRATCWLRLGQRGRAQHELRRLGLVPDGLLTARIRGQLLAFAISSQQGCADQALLDGALALVKSGVLPHVRLAIEIELASQLPPAEGVAALLVVGERARQLDLSGHVLETHVRAAQIALTHDREAARDHAVTAMAMSETFEFFGSYRGDLWLHCARALFAAGDDARARFALASGSRWIRATAHDHVSDAFRASFLQRNPVNAALLALDAKERRITG